MGVPEVLVRHRPVGHNDFKLAPDGIAAVAPAGTGRRRRADPDDAVVPRLAGTIGNLAVPLVIGPGVAVPVCAVEAGFVPGARPAHLEMVVAVGRVAPDRAVEIPVDAVSRADEDAGTVVVAELVKAVRSCVAEVRRCSGLGILRQLASQDKGKKHRYDDAFHSTPPERGPVKE
ncbi:MAG: hypothetical protein UY26_C0002G0100 [Candidatus Jorgensenbacteria bacterium GW2011_GWA1_48_13]|uniref:Uncharacterized protein n=1 Tax=Candidatus Jorgensenbacteria bacterium GW2011_GWB1_50_10 TaxID=1618665 RepID=A0A0G1W9D2_9BACT|nr:MAG: hypothetical protein UY26_C0002G0100 [Candidatus Jorgensenbacteria bacterium GW2011_GWA1_48_13]KKW15411.1 MAG: hypothetical protein UY55_C0001G0165 [Candidatus Jorgensenbacteria bacterium GW2011_GWB1_50_10]